MAQLNGRNTPFVCCAQIDWPEPEGQGQTSAVHDRSGGYGGLVPAGTALEGVTTVDGVVFHAAALGAYEPIWKAKSEQFRSASILAVVTAAKFLECDLSCACHAVGLFLAIFFARSVEKKKEEEQAEDYGTEGMCLGMCLGTAIGTSFGNNTGIGISLGMPIGLAVGSSIKKEHRNEDQNEK